MVCTNCGREYEESIEKCPTCGTLKVFSEFGGFDWSLAEPAVATYILEGVKRLNGRVARSINKSAVKEYLAAEGLKVGDKRGLSIAIAVLEAHNLILRLVMVIRLLRTIEQQSPCNDESLENAITGASNMLLNAAQGFGEITGITYEAHVVEVTDACLELLADFEKGELPNPLNEMLGFTILYSTTLILDNLELVCRVPKVEGPLAYSGTLGDVALDYYAALAGHVTGVALVNKDLWKQVVSGQSGEPNAT